MKIQRKTSKFSYKLYNVRAIQHEVGLDLSNSNGYTYNEQEKSYLLLTMTGFASKTVLEVKMEGLRCL